jgi:hypothetical protein
MKNQFKFYYCTFCEDVYVYCPKCGNNCCNGTYGTIQRWNEEKMELEEVDCDVCQQAYEYQDRARREGWMPTKEQIEKGRS